MNATFVWTIHDAIAVVVLAGGLLWVLGHRVVIGLKALWNWQPELECEQCGIKTRALTVKVKIIDGVREDRVVCRDRKACTTRAP